MGSPEVAADASTHLKGEGEPHCRWAMAGSGPLREKEEELAAGCSQLAAGSQLLAERSAVGDYRPASAAGRYPGLSRNDPLLLLPSV